MKRTTGTDWESEHMGTFSGCSGPCNQGRRLCPCPEACRSTEATPEGQRLGLLLLMVSALCVLAFALWLTS